MDGPAPETPMKSYPREEIEDAGEGRFSFQEDIYNWEETVAVLKEWAAAQPARAGAKP